MKNFRVYFLGVFLLALTCSTNTLFAQTSGDGIEVPRDKITDVFDELESDQLSLRFLDALTGDGISDGQVLIEGIGSYQTDFEGKLMFDIPPDGFYHIKFQRQGYISSDFKIEIMAGTLFFNRFSISPEVPLGTIRVVLDWDKNPKDLDAHLEKRGDYHISYRNKSVSADGVAKLDRDDTNGYGPETITANAVDPGGVYHYFVHDYSNKDRDNCKKLSKSKASVKIYGGDNRLLHVFDIPRDQIGNHWFVFSIENGKISSQNLMLNAQP